MAEISPEQKIRQDDEIDLFELFETLLNGKWIITLFTVLSISLGYVYAITTPTTYEAKFPYIVNLSSVEAQQKGGNTSAQSINSISSEIIGATGSFNSKQSIYTALISTQEDATNIAKHLNQANELTTKNFLTQAKKEIQLIEHSFSSNLQGTERVATNLINAKRLEEAIEENGLQVLTLQNPTVTLKSPKLKLIIPLSFVLGGMLGIFFVLLQQAYLNRIEKRNNVSI